MKIVGKALALFFVLISTAVAQNAPPSYIVHGNCNTGLPKYQEWLATTQLQSGTEFVASAKRKQQILHNYAELRLGMSLKQVEDLLGKPDFASASAKGHLQTLPAPANSSCSNQIAYILQKKSGNMTDMDDVAVYVFFSPDDELTWASPQNVSELKTIGGPTP